jgi:hypothetical protein
MFGDYEEAKRPVVGHYNKADGTRGSTWISRAIVE